MKELPYALPNMQIPAQMFLTHRHLQGHAGHARRCARSGHAGASSHPRATHLSTFLFLQVEEALEAPSTHILG